jgi:type II secretory pathway predicted ATPase ExeA
MIKSFFGISRNPFSLDSIFLLPFQQEICDILNVHSQQGGLCLIMGEPGTGKSIIKDSIVQKADKRSVVVTVGRTLHTYTNTVKILCHAFNIEFIGDSFKCEKRLIEEAYSLNRQGKIIMTVIDDAHLMDITTLRRLRLLFDDFPRNHNLVLVGQVELLACMCLKVNEDIKSRVTYSVTTPKINPDDMQGFILSQLDHAGLGHNTFTDDALSLIIRSSDGILRKARNLSIASLFEAVRQGKKIIDIDVINRVLIQPHWRVQNDLQAVML